MIVTVDEVRFLESVWVVRMRFLYQPDTVLTAADLETVALELLSEFPICQISLPYPYQESRD